MTSTSVDAEWQPSELELSRRVLRRRATTRSVLIALLSSIVLVTVLLLVVVNTPGWAVVSQTFFDPQVALESIGPIFQGLLVNLLVLAIAVVCVAIFGTLLATMRSLRGPVFFPLRALAAAYTDFFRGIPLLIVLYLVGFGIPALMIFPRMPAMFWGTIALVLTYSAYVAEVLRAGMEAVHPSQRIAARSLGLTHGQTLRIVVIPQGVRKVVPALMNDFVSMQKDVGLISVLGAVDAVRAAQLMVAETYNYTPYLVAGLMFIILSWPMIRLTDIVTARMNKREQAGGVV
ncbi:MULTISPECIES: amino acid ABC transporter permease [Microbacterium]|jgi:polar amino acid transport system permease protein|uniref:Amino acid ABC transporter permease n=1 Tax=Microbacterium aurugineum TaxID=2851642 RepID=A0ABY4IVE1_9MICO|nr:MULTISPECIES: amino acid ABC transporter permease [Microbacterium]MCE0510676.1 amino acid ABC transporter permease [Microbacterium sp. KKR3/1]MCK8467858.1 amino acid ABC transporter permease [Microbacterium aurugineum]MCK8475651.1 amino acid ABC transporter permease [Microbacterium aurugineum]MCZ4303037.1 amino acid ABC transporter permease [Microbacterium oxydans]QEA27834.1 amino acid ABC transporter permease [Microbacterium sp. CBA3102]